MLVTYNWIKEFVDVFMPPAELAAQLTMLGLEVVSIKKVGIDEELAKKVKLARVKEVLPHPNADQLKICRVNAGKAKLQVITNSTAVKKGDWVVVALSGAVLPCGITVKMTEIRGELSEGILLPKKYLNLEEKSTDIWILGDDEKQAKQEFEIFTQSDTLFEIELTANRSDCLSVIGIAREVAALLNNELKLKPVQLTESIDESPDIQILDKNLCPRYSSRIIKGIKTTESPAWIRRKLELCGLRAINNLVDATNYVLLEMGHPTHAFDLNRLEKQKIIVRRAKPDESIVTLDGTECKLNEEMLVIADQSKPVALAGIMGGENSEINSDTTDILLESAYFDPVSIRKTSRALGLKTDAAYHFERTADWGITVAALDRVCELILQSTEGQISKLNDQYVNIIKDKVVVLKNGFVSSHLGVNISLKDAEDYLRRLGFSITVRREDSLEVKIPTFRSDVSRPIDLVEEIARLYGYNNIPVNLFKPPIVIESLARERDIKTKIREILNGLGFTEIYNYSFYSDEELKRFKINNHSIVRLKNPMSQDATVLRNYLFGGLLKSIDFNIKSAYRNDIRFFEIGHVFEIEQDQYIETERLCFALYGKDYSYSQILGYAEYLLQKLGANNLGIKPAKLSFMHPANSATLLYQKNRIGFLGELHPDIIDAMGLRERVFITELNINVLEMIYSLPIVIGNYSKFPPADRDLSIVVNESVMARNIINTIYTFHQWIQKVKFLDIFRGDKIGKGKKSLTFSLTFQSQDRTLNDEEINQVMINLINKLETTYKAELRT